MFFFFSYLHILLLGGPVAFRRRLFSEIKNRKTATSVSLSDNILTTKSDTFLTMTSTEELEDNSLLDIIDNTDSNNKMSASIATYDDDFERNSEVKESKSDVIMDDTDSNNKMSASIATYDDDFERNSEVKDAKVDAVEDANNSNNKNSSSNNNSDNSDSKVSPFVFGIKKIASESSISGLQIGEGESVQSTKSDDEKKAYYGADEKDSKGIIDNEGYSKSSENKKTLTNEEKIKGPSIAESKLDEIDSKVALEESDRQLDKKETQDSINITKDIKVVEEKINKYNGEEQKVEDVVDPLTLDKDDVKASKEETNSYKEEQNVGTSSDKSTEVDKVVNEETLKQDTTRSNESHSTDKKEKKFEYSGTNLNLAPRDILSDENDKPSLEKENMDLEESIQLIRMEN